MFFDGFALEMIDTGEATLRVRYGGAGTPVLLLHGHPRTHATWHRVAPLLVLWAGKDDLPDLYGDVLEVWRRWTDDVRGRALNCGHHMAEEAPEELATELRVFFA